MKKQHQSDSNILQSILDQQFSQNNSISSDYPHGQSLDYDIFDNAIQNPLNGQLFVSKFKIQNKKLSKCKLKKPKQNTPKEITYQFPIDLFKYQILRGRKQFKELMKKESGSKQYHKGWSINKKKLMNKQYGIYIRCSLCKASINYHQKQNHTWILINYKNHHTHSNLKIFEPQIQIKQQNQETKQIPNFIQLKHLLKSLDYEYRYQPNKNVTSVQIYPKTIVAASLHQKFNYQKYGQCVNYDIIYSTINEKKLGLGIFYGFDNNNRIIIFGFSITIDQTVQNIKNKFNWFFYLMGFCKTTTIVTDQQNMIISALKSLKQDQMYKYEHIYDNSHFIRSVITDLNSLNKQTVQLLVNKLNKIIRQSDPKVGESKLNQLKRIMIKQKLQKQYQNIQDKIQRVCLWNIPKTFVGLSIQSNQRINDLVKLKIQQQTSLYDVILKLDKFSKQRNQKCSKSIIFQKYPFQTYYDDSRIQQIRQKYQKKVFIAFMYNYNRSQFYKIIQYNKQTNQYQIQHRIDHDIYHIINNLCSCQALQKTGIPCQHIIFLKKVKYLNDNYSQLIYQRWLIPQQKMERIIYGKKIKIKEDQNLN